MKCTCSMKKHPWANHARRCPVYKAGMEAARAYIGRRTKNGATELRTESKRTPRKIEATRHGHDVVFTVEANKTTPHGFSGVLSTAETKILIKLLTIAVLTKPEGN